jgi:hypothetical protein
MQNKKLEVPPHTCRGCSNKWTGVNRAHCSVCHITFGGPTKFDEHRRRNKCLTLKLIAAPIEEGGLGLSDNGKGVWTSAYLGGEDEEGSDISDWE